MLIGIDREVVEGKKCTIVKVWLDHVIIRSCDLFTTGRPSVVQECLSWWSFDPLTDGIPSDERFAIIVVTRVCIYVCLCIRVPVYYWVCVFVCLSIYLFVCIL